MCFDSTLWLSTVNNFFLSYFPLIIIDDSLALSVVGCPLKICFKLSCGLIIPHWLIVHFPTKKDTSGENMLPGRSHRFSTPARPPASSRPGHAPSPQSGAPYGIESSY